MYISISSYTYTYTYRYIHIHINIYIHTSSTATTTMTHPHIHRVGGGTRNQRKSAASETSRAPPQPHNHRGGGTMTHPQGGGGGGGRRCTIYTYVHEDIECLAKHRSTVTGSGSLDGLLHPNVQMKFPKQHHHCKQASVSRQSHRSLVEVLLGVKQPMQIQLKDRILIER